MDAYFTCIREHTVIRPQTSVDFAACQYILDALTEAPNGHELSPPEMEEWIGNRNAVNRYFAARGYTHINVNQKTYIDGPYGLGWCSPCLDQGLSALLTDLRDRGLLGRTLVVVMGEFGRTPKINQPRGNPGRQHWPACWSARSPSNVRRSLSAVFNSSASVRRSK